MALVDAGPRDGRAGCGTGPCRSAAGASGSGGPAAGRRRTSQRRGLAAGRAGRSIHPARSRRGAAAHRAHRAPGPVRPRRHLFRRASVRQRSLRHRPAPLGARRPAGCRFDPDRPRYAPRPAHRRAVHRHRGRRAARREHLERRQRRQLVGRGLGLGRRRRRPGLERRAADSLQSASLRCRRPAGLGHQRHPAHPAQAGEHLAGHGAAQRERLCLEDGAARRAGGRHAPAAAGGRALYGAAPGERGARGRRPVQRRGAHVSGRRRGPQDEPAGRPDARCDRQPRLRPGRGGSGRDQPVGLRDLFRREAALLHRRSGNLRQLRVQRREQLLRVQHVGPDDLLLAADRPAAPGRRGRGGLHGRPGVDDDPGGGESDGTDLQRLEHRPARRPHRTRARAPGARGVAITRGRGAADQLLRRAGPPGLRARGGRDDRDRGDAPAACGPAPRPAPWPRGRVRGRWVPVPPPAQGLGRQRQVHGQLRRGQRGRHGRASESRAAVLPAAGRAAGVLRSSPAFAAGICRTVQPEPQRRHMARERVALDGEPGVRLERCGFHGNGRSARGPYRAARAQGHARSLDAPPELLDRARRRLELQRRPRERHLHGMREHHVSQLLGLIDLRERVRRLEGRSPHAGRAAVAAARVCQRGRGARHGRPAACIAEPECQREPQLVRRFRPRFRPADDAQADGGAQPLDRSALPARSGCRTGT